MLSAIMYGARISLLVGVASVLLSPWWSASRWACCQRLSAAARVDALIMRVADVQLSFPSILIALLIDGVGARASSAQRARHARASAC